MNSEAVIDETLAAIKYTWERLGAYQLDLTHEWSDVDMGHARVVDRQLAADIVLALVRMGRL